MAFARFKLINNSLPAFLSLYSGLRAKRMVCILPLCSGHSAKMTVLDNAACNLFRATSLVGLAFTPKGCSVRISPPLSKIRCWREVFSFGCTMFSPEATMAIVCPPASRQPSCAALSHTLFSVRLAKPHVLQ